MILGYTPHFWETTIYLEIVPVNHSKPHVQMALTGDIPWITMVSP